MAFKLEKILGSQTNAPELFVDVPCGVASETTWKEGAGIRVDAGVASTVGTKNAAQYIVMRTTKTFAATDVIPCYVVTTDMIFRIPMSSAYNATTWKVGNQINILPGGEQGTPVAAALGYAPVIVDTLGAAKTKDEMLVKYMAINTVKES